MLSLTKSKSGPPCVTLVPPYDGALIIHGVQIPLRGATVLLDMDVAKDWGFFDGNFEKESTTS